MKAFKYVLGTEFLSVVIPGRGVFPLSSSNETFPAMKRALLRKQWTRVPKLISLAEKMASESFGRIHFEKGIPFYKNKPLQGYLGNKLAELYRQNQRVSHLLKFADNLMKNPDDKTIPEVLEFLEVSNMPITDDGCFLAYKCINKNYTDCYSGVYNNTPGETPRMPRKEANSSSRVACSDGFHFAALDYIKGGFGSSTNRVVMIKINPRDVVAIPEYKQNLKGRCWQYEVVKELFSIQEASQLQDHPEMLLSVVAIAKERRELLKQLLDSKVIAKMVRRGKIKRTTLMKMTYARLAKLAQQHLTSTTPVAAPSPVLADNPLKAQRVKLGLTVGQVAKASGMTYKAVWAAEKAVAPTQDTIDKYLAAINKLGLPKAPQKARAAAASASTESPRTHASNPAYNESEEYDSDEELYEDDEDDYGY